MSVKTAGVGHFTIPTAPAAGTSCTSGAANVFTTTYVQLIASTVAALYITGIHLEAAAAKAATYITVQLAAGAAASETIIGQYLVPLTTASTVALGYRPIFPPIPVANAARISCKTADSVGAAATLVTLECIAQSNVVDDAIPITTVTTTTNLTNAPPDSAGVTTLLTRAPSLLPVATDFTVARAAKMDNLDATISSRSTYAGGAVASVTGAVGSVTGNVGGNVTGSVGSVLGAVASVTANVNADLKKINGTTVNGNGAGTPWGP